MRLKYRFGDKDKRRGQWIDCGGDVTDMAVAAVYKATAEQLGEAPSKVRIYFADGQHLTFKAVS